MPRSVKRLAAVLGLLSALAPGPAAYASPEGVADLINRLRSGAGKCGGQPDLPNFTRRAELDRAAAMLAGGGTLQASVRAAGYPSVMVKSIVMSGSTDPRALEGLLAGNYCATIVERGLSDLGIHQQGVTTTVLLAAAFAPAAGLDDSGLAARLLTLVNQARAQARNCGPKSYPPAGPVRWNETLERAARAHSEDMARKSYFAHNAPDGTTPAARVERAGYDYRTTGENIAAGQMTAEAAVESWIASPTHCANLMQADYTEMGVAMASNRQSAMGTYWTQVFGTPHVARTAKP